MPHSRNAPIRACIDSWLPHHFAPASAKSPLGEALAHIAEYRDCLGPLLQFARCTADDRCKPLATLQIRRSGQRREAGSRGWHSPSRNLGTHLKPRFSLNTSLVGLLLNFQLSALAYCN